MSTRMKHAMNSIPLLLADLVDLTLTDEVNASNGSKILAVEIVFLAKSPIVVH